MSSKVRLPPLLRSHTGGSGEVLVEGSTLGEALGNLTAAWPGLRDSIYTGDTLHRFINIYINDDDVRYLGGLGAVLSEGDTITLLPAVAGGMSSYLAEPPAGAARAVSP